MTTKPYHPTHCLYPDCAEAAEPGSLICGTHRVEEQEVLDRMDRLEAAEMERRSEEMRGH